MCFAHSGATRRPPSASSRPRMIPPGVTFGQAKGFALWATRSILGGSGGDVIEVARRNLRQVETEFV
jgi:pyruvate dehydrogenase (quinone)